MINLQRVSLFLSILFGLSACGLTEHMGRSCGGDLKELCYNIVGGRNDSREDDGIGGLQDKVALLEKQMQEQRDQLVIFADLVSSDGGLADQVSAINSAILALQATDTNLQSQLTSVQSSLAQALSDASALAGRVSTVEGNTTTLQLSTNALQASLASLSAYVNTLVGQGTTAYNQIEVQLTALQTQGATATSDVSGLNTAVTVLQASMNSTLVQLAVLQGYKSIVSIKDPCGAQGNVWNEVFLKLSDGSYVASFSDNASGLNTRFTLLKDGSYVTTDGTNCYFSVSGSGTVISNEHN